MKTETTCPVCRKKFHVFAVAEHYRNTHVLPLPPLTEKERELATCIMIGLAKRLVDDDDATAANTDR